MSDPVLLIHGHPFDHTMWDPQATALRAAGHRVIAPDLRGYGAAEVVPGITLFDGFARDLAGLLDRLDVPRAVVGGVSMGGQIAMEFHRLFPERVAALILADTSPVAETEQGRIQRDALADRLVAEGMAGYAAEVIDRMIAPEHVTGMPAVADHVLRMMHATAPEGAAAALRGRSLRPDYQASLAAARVPALILVGAGDTYTPVEQAELLHDLIIGSELVVIDQAAHLPGLEQPAAFNEAVLQFLSKI
ncbi:alpha/beta fold hydrolase [Micromonosporaceae bacterium Da 78-11]